MGRIIEKNGKKYIKYTKDNEEFLIRYKEHNNKNQSVVVKRILLASFLFALFSFCRSEKKWPGLIPTKLIMHDLTLDEINEKIEASSNLNDNEKEYLCNEKYFNDVLPYINKKMLAKYYFSDHLENVDITSFSKEKAYKKNISGYYTLAHPHTLFVKEYDCMSPWKKDTVAHEFIHMCQIPLKREILTEASAEIISDEYYEDTVVDTYQREVSLTKILMEIIGSEPIWHYNFTGDFSMIEERVKPYLNEEDYKTFLKFKTFSDNDATQAMNCVELYGILEKLYKTKYGDDMSKDIIIECIKNHKPISRYYFNDDYINYEHSYYYNRELQDTNLKAACTLGDIYFCMLLNDIIPYERAVEFVKEYKNANSKFRGYIYGYSENGFEQIMDLESLEKNKSKYQFYYVVGHKRISYESFSEHIKHPEWDTRYKVISKQGSVLKFDEDEHIEYYKNVKKSIPTIDEVNESFQKKLINPKNIRKRCN